MNVNAPTPAQPVTCASFTVRAKPASSEEGLYSGLAPLDASNQVGILGGVRAEMIDSTVEPVVIGGF